MCTDLSKSLNFQNTIRDELPGVKPGDIELNCRFLFIKKNNKTIKVSLFLVKIYELQNREEYNDIISWTNGGNSFIIKNIDLLEKTLLAKLFQHNLFSSFQ